MAGCPVCGGLVRLAFRGVRPWRCPSCQSLLRLGSPYDAGHPLVFPFLWLLPFLRDLEVLERSPDYCARCGYNLKGNVSGICPECGIRIPSRPPPSELGPP